MNTHEIDLNADLGESFGLWKMGDDEGVLRWVTSANIACGFHAGDPEIMKKTVALCIQQHVSIGAHPAFFDIQGFGRRVINISVNEIYSITLYQIGALSAFTKAVGSSLQHVKPHGALYNVAARDSSVADAIARAVRDFSRSLTLVGLAGSALIAAGRERGLLVRQEGFCDRRYLADGSLTPRTQQDSVIEDIDQAIAQAISIATRQEVVTRDGTRVGIEADTLCIHGDRTNAAAFAKGIRQGLGSSGVKVAAAVTSV